MSDMAQEGFPEDRRAFFRTLGRNLVLGVTGGGIAAMIQYGRINTCINEASPCSSCVMLKPRMTEMMTDRYPNSSMVCYHLLFGVD